MLDVPVAPARSLEQRRVALAEANRIRTHRKWRKMDLRAGRVGLMDVLADPDFDTAKVYDVLVALPKIGRVKATRVLRDARISPSRTLAGLSDRQRRELVGAMSGRSPAAFGRL